MTAPTPHLEILVIASDSDDRHTLTAQALGVLLDLDTDTDPARIFQPVRLRIRQRGADIFDQSAPLASVFYGLTEWGYSVTLADWGRTELPQPQP